MSIQTWKKEFYSSSAKSTSKKNSIAHSLRKWQGLTKANIKKHDLIKDGACLESSDESIAYFSVDSDSCALCEKYMDHFRADDNPCFLCPLYNLLGKACDKGNSSPYVIWWDTCNAKPMINALKKILAQELKNNKGKLK